MAPKQIFFNSDSEGYSPSPAAEAASSSHIIWPDSESTEERPLPGGTVPVYSDFLQEVQLTDTESEVEAAKRAAGQEAGEAAADSEQGAGHPPRLPSRDLLQADLDRAIIRNLEVPRSLRYPVDRRVAKSAPKPSTLPRTGSGISMAHIQRNGASSALPVFPEKLLSITGIDSASSLPSLTDLDPMSFPQFEITLRSRTWRDSSLT